MTQYRLPGMTGLVAALALTACGSSTSPNHEKSTVSTTGSTGGSSSSDAATGASSGDAAAGLSSGDAAPPPGTTAYSFQTGTFSVPAGGEVYKCQDFTNPFGSDIGIVQWRAGLADGTHHAFAFVLPTDQLTLEGSLQDCPSGGLEFHEYIGVSDQPELTVTYPAGIGRVLTTSTGLRLMLHLLNTGTAPKTAFMKFGVSYEDPSLLQQRAASLFLINSKISVPPGASTATASYALPTDIWMLGAASHMHSHGTHFVATTDTGLTLYDGTQWSEPAPKTFNPPLPLTSGTMITFTCTYQNNTTQTLTFGESAGTNEMCNFPGEFYNSAGDQLSAVL